MSGSADMEQTDVSLAVYRTSFEFCCVCLKTRAESLLQQTNANDFLAAIQVQQVSPWLCVWCLASVRSFYRLKNKAQRSQQWLHNVGLEIMISSENLELASELKQIKSEPYTVKILQHDECTISERSSESCVKIKQEHREGRPVDCQIVTRSCRKKRENWFQIGPAEAGDSQFYDKSSQFNQVIYIKSDSLNNSDDFDSRMSPEQIPPKLKRNRGRPRKISVKTKSITEKTRAAASPVKKENKYSVKRSTSNRRYAVGFTMTEAERQRDYEDRLARPQYVEAFFKCEKCGLGWHHREAYLKHIKSHSPSSGPLHCKICDSYYPTQNAIDSHTWNHYRRFRCVLCGYVGSSGAVSTHYFAVHSTDEFACEQCGRSFKRPKHLERHIERMHSDRKPHRCTLCFKVLWTEAALKYHMWSHNAKKKVWFSCDICHKKFPLKGNLKNHLKVHAPKKEPKDEEETQAVPVVCSICFKEFGSYDKLDRHMRRCHTVKKYQCDHCKKCFFSKSELKRHIYDVHLKIMAYACPNCVKMCPSKYSLRRHILRIHETVRVKDKLCDLCGKGFWTRQLLEKHRYTHTGERPYSCHYCGASFAQRSTMTTHIKLKHLKMKRTASGAFLKNESNVIL